MNVFYLQKEERNAFSQKRFIIRDKLKDTLDQLSSPLIKIIMGPRRAGKSVFAGQLLQDKEYAYLNFDNEALLTLSHQTLIEGIKTAYPSMQYILLDEIENLHSWELFVNQLQRLSYNIVLTGSNANLLSKELATNLTGRYMETEILPFSFHEFLNIRKLETPDSVDIFTAFGEYMNTGGFPEIIINKVDGRSYLQTLFDAVVFKDIVKRFHIRYTTELDSLAGYLIANTTHEYSLGKLQKFLDVKSRTTIQKYISYLQESYLFESVKKYSFKIKEIMNSQRKIFAIDNGLIKSKALNISPDLGLLFENAIFIGLRQKGYTTENEIFFYKTKTGKEVDFIIKKGQIIDCLYQVCYNPLPVDTLHREVSALLQASDELRCDNLKIITSAVDKTETMKGKTIQYISAAYWLGEEEM